MAPRLFFEYICTRWNMRTFRWTGLSIPFLKFRPSENSDKNECKMILDCSIWLHFKKQRSLFLFCPALLRFKRCYAYACCYTSMTAWPYIQSRVMMKHCRRSAYQKSFIICHCNDEDVDWLKRLRKVFFSLHPESAAVTILLLRQVQVRGSPTITESLLRATVVA